MNYSLNSMIKYTLLCVCFLLQTINSPLWAQSTKISVAMEQVTLRKVFNEIEKKTDYLFVYTAKDVNVQQKVSIHAQNQPVSEILNQIFKSTRLRYVLEGKNIMVLPAENLQQGAGSQQSSPVKGVIKDPNGEPVIGANIVIEGTTTGTITDIWIIHDMFFTTI